MKKIMITIVLMAFAGCADLTPEDRAAEVINGLELPPKAENVVVLSEKDGWHTYELVIDGHRRKFLRQKSGEFQDRMTSNVEVTPR